MPVRCPLSAIATALGQRACFRPSCGRTGPRRHASRLRVEWPRFQGRAARLWIRVISAASREAVARWLSTASAHSDPMIGVIAKPRTRSPAQRCCGRCLWRPSDRPLRAGSAVRRTIAIAQIRARRSAAPLLLTSRADGVRLCAAARFRIRTQQDCLAGQPKESVVLRSTGCLACRRVGRITPLCRRLEHMAWSDRASLLVAGRLNDVLGQQLDAG